MDITNSHKPQYRFPILKNNEIIECLTDAGIDVSSNELVEPNRHKDKVKSIFTDLVLIGLNLPKDTFTTTSMSLMKKRQNLPHPELHDESFANLKFIKALMKLMIISGIHDFGMSDLYAPTTKRFKRQLSGIINYIKFTIEKRATLIHEMDEQKDELINELLSVQQEQEMLHQQLDSVQRDAEKKWEEAKLVGGDCEDIEIEISRQNKLQTSIRQESENLKKFANVLKDKIDTADLVSQELAAKERKFSSQVVQSPRALEENISSSKTTLAEERKFCDEMEQNDKMTVQYVKLVTKAQDNVAEVTTLIRQVMEDKIRYEKSLEDSKAIEAKIMEHNTKSGEYQETYDKIENQFRQIKEKSNNFKQQAKTKMNAARASLHAVNAELLIVEKDRRDVNSKVEQCEQEVQTLKRVIDEEKTKTDQEIEDIVLNFQKMEKVLIEKIDKFDGSIGEILKQ